MRNPRQHLARTYARHVPTSAQYFNGQNVQSPIQWRRISNAGGADRVEQGNTFWVPIRVGGNPYLCG